MQWLVLLEAERNDDAGPSDLKRLVHELADPAPGALQSEDRYALQLEVAAAGPPEAIDIAVRRWTSAHHALGLRPGSLLRVEALTREEYEHECLADEAQADPDPALTKAPFEVSQRGMEEALLRHAFHDVLTDLAGQGLFRAQLEHALSGLDRNGEPCAVLLLDVDRFADVNQRFGRSGTDGVLVALAKRIQRASGRPNGVGRLGGDQFGVILRGMSLVEASSTARRIFDETTAPLVVGGTEVRPTISGGIALGERGDTADDLLHRATLALRTAQERGRARFEVFAQGMAGADVRRLLAEREAMASPDTSSYLGLLERLSLAIAGCRTLEDAAFAALRQLCEHARFPLGRLYLAAEDGQTELCAARTWIVGPPERFGDFGDGAGRVLRHGEGVAGRAVASRRPFWVRDIAAEPGLAMPHDAVAAGLRGGVALPVVVDDRTEAVLELFADENLEFGDPLVQFLTVVGAQLATVARQAHAERAGVSAEARLRLLLGHSGVHVNVLDPNGKLREQYPATWPHDVALPISAVDLVHPDDIATAVRGWADALAAPGLHAPFECRVAGPNATWRWVEVTAMNMVEEPEIRAVVTYTRDIGELKELEGERHNAVAHLRDAESMARVGTWRADLLTGEVHWSDEMYRVLGLEPGAIEPGVPGLLSLAHPDDRVVFEEQRRRLRTGTPQHFTFRVVGATGTIRWISGRASPELDASGRVVALQGAAQDITERKALERALRESEQRLRLVEAIAGVGSWRTDAATNATVWSPRLYEILGLDPAAASPGLDTLLSVVHPQDRPGVEAHALLQHRLALPMDFEFRIIRPDGDLRWARIQLSVTYDNAGAVAAFHGLVWDTTDRKTHDARTRV